MKPAPNPVRPPEVLNLLVLGPVLIMLALWIDPVGNSLGTTLLLIAPGLSLFVASLLRAIKARR